MSQRQPITETVKCWAGEPSAHVPTGRTCHLSPICQRCSRCVGCCLCPPPELRATLADQTLADSTITERGKRLARKYFTTK